MPVTFTNSTQNTHNSQSKSANIGNFADNSQYLTFDLDQTRQFLAALAPDGVLHFQTFDDDSVRKNQSLARTYPATSLQSALPFLTGMQQRGAGAFVTVNQCRGDKRTNDAVIGIRAVFCDFDPPDTAQCPDVFPLPPSIIVSTSTGKYHTYWLVDDCSLDQYSAIQRSLIAQFNSDPAPKDLARVMRLPGFYHQKHGRVMSQLVECYPERRYTVAQIQNELLGGGDIFANATGNKTPRASTSPVKTKHVKLVTAPIDYIAPTASAKHIARALEFIPPDVDYQTWCHVGMAIHDGMGDDGFALWDAWSSKGAKYVANEMCGKWDSFTRGRGIKINSLFYTAQQFGFESGFSFKSFDDALKQAALCDPDDASYLSEQIWQRFKRSFVPRKLSPLAFAKVINAVCGITAADDVLTTKAVEWQAVIDAGRKLRLPTHPDCSVKHVASIADVYDDINRRIDAGERVFAIVNADMGAGKTQILLKKLRAQFEHVIAIAPRVALTFAQALQLNLTHYKAADSNSCALSLCVNSFLIEKFLNWLAYAELFLVDECTAIHHEARNPKSHYGQQAPAVLRAFHNQVESTRHVVFADADVSGVEVDMLHCNINRESIFYVVKNPAQHRKTFVVESENASLERLIDDFDAGKNTFYAADSSRFINKINNALKARALANGQLPDNHRAIQSLLGACTSSDPENIALLAEIANKNPAALQFIRSLGISPAVESGTSLETKHFDTHHAFYGGVITPAKMHQMCHRDRTATTVYASCRGTGYKDQLPITPQTIELRALATAKFTGGQFDGLTQYDLESISCENYRRSLTNNYFTNFIGEVAARGHKVVLPTVTNEQLAVFIELRSQLRDIELHIALENVPTIGGKTLAKMRSKLLKKIVSHWRAIIAHGQTQKVSDFLNSGAQYAHETTCAIINAHDDPAPEIISKFKTSNSSRTMSEDAQLSRYLIREATGWAGTDIPDELIRIWDNGRLNKQVAFYEQFTTAPSNESKVDSWENDHGVVTVARKHRLAGHHAMFALWQTFFPNDGGDLVLTETTIRQLLRDFVACYPEYAAVLQADGIRVDEPAAGKATFWLGQLARRAGLTLVALPRRRIDGAVAPREYSLSPESVSLMNAVQMSRGGRSSDLLNMVNKSLDQPLTGDVQAAKKALQDCKNWGENRSVVIRDLVRLAYYPAAPPGG